MKAIRLARLALLAAILPTLASGCVVTASTPPYARHAHVVVAPPPRVEVVTVAPYPHYVWIGGHWTWQAHGHQHHWVPGRWEAPRHGHRWAPHRWERHGDSWRERHGRWERHEDRRDNRHERRGRGGRG